MEAFWLQVTPFKLCFLGFRWKRWSMDWLSPLPSAGLSRHWMFYLYSWYSCFNINVLLMCFHKHYLYISNARRWVVLKLVCVIIKERRTSVIKHYKSGQPYVNNINKSAILLLKFSLLHLRRTQMSAVVFRTSTNYFSAMKNNLNHGLFNGVLGSFGYCLAAVLLAADSGLWIFSVGADSTCASLHRYCYKAGRRTSWIWPPAAVPCQWSLTNGYKAVVV